MAHTLEDFAELLLRYPEYIGLLSHLKGLEI